MNTEKQVVAKTKATMLPREAAVADNASASAQPKNETDQVQKQETNQAVSKEVVAQANVPDAGAGGRVEQEKNGDTVQVVPKDDVAGNESGDFAEVAKVLEDVPRKNDGGDVFDNVDENWLDENKGALTNEEQTGGEKNEPAVGKGQVKEELMDSGAADKAQVGKLARDSGELISPESLIDSY